MAEATAVDLVQVRWRVVPTQTPRVVRWCPRCQAPRRFASSDRFRLNANQRRVDVWLIYRCTVCETTWNHAVHERQRPQDIGANRYALYQYNDVETAWQCAFAAISQGVSGVEPDVPFRIEAQPIQPVRPARIVLVLEHRLRIRLDRLLAAGFEVSRTTVQSWERSGALTIEHGDHRALRRPAQDGQLILLRSA